MGLFSSLNYANGNVEKAILFLVLVAIVFIIPYGTAYWENAISAFPTPSA